MLRQFPVPKLTQKRLSVIEKLGQMDMAELNHIGEAGILSEDRRQAIVDLLQDREPLRARIRELERLMVLERENRKMAIGGLLEERKKLTNRVEELELFFWDGRRPGKT